MNALVILAGGKSSRMGKDKTFLPYQGTTFLGYLLQKADGIFDRVLISVGSREHGNAIDQWLRNNQIPCTRLQPEIVIEKKTKRGLGQMDIRSGIRRIAFRAVYLP